MPDSTASNKTESIAAVVVTYNRLSLLQGCVDSLMNQTHKCSVIIVVDNGSTDGTEEWCRSLGGRIDYIRQDNMGCSAGMSTGIKHAVSIGHAWFWLMDDDTLPHPDALEAMVYSPAFLQNDTGFLCSVNKMQNGKLGNLSDPLGIELWMDTILETRSLPVRSTSFVSMMVHKRAISRVGLPMAGFFIWADDVEFSTRISSSFNCYLVLNSIVTHPTGCLEPAQAALSPHSIKFWCLFRNWVAYDIFVGKGFVRTSFRIIRRLLYLSKEAKNLTAKMIALRAALDGIYLALKNRSFIRPLQSPPSEQMPPVLPWPVRKQRSS